MALGCSSDDGAPTESLITGLESLTGTVIEIDDKVPVDGPVILALELDSGGTDTAYLPSFFRPTPIPPGQWEIYQQIRALDIGSRIRVEGVRTPFGLGIMKLTVLGSSRGRAFPQRWTS